MSSWANDLTTLREIKGQKYRMLTSIYTTKEIYKVEDCIDLIKDSTRAMMTLYDQIKEVENIAKAQILEVDKFYSVASMEIIIDNSMDELASIETIFW